jgi:hypothetical protein
MLAISPAPTVLRQSRPDRLARTREYKQGGIWGQQYFNANRSVSGCRVPEIATTPCPPRFNKQEHPLPLQKRRSPSQPLPLPPQRLIHFLEDLAQLHRVPARPGVACCLCLTLCALRPGGLLPRLPPLNGFALALPLLCCPVACCHGVDPLKVRFAKV